MSSRAFSLSDHLRSACRRVARFGGGPPASAAGILAGTGQQEPEQGDEMTGEEDLRLIREIEANRAFLLAIYQ